MPKQTTWFRLGMETETLSSASFSFDALASLRVHVGRVDMNTENIRKALARAEALQIQATEAMAKLIASNERLAALHLLVARLEAEAAESSANNNQQGGK